MINKSLTTRQLILSTRGSQKIHNTIGTPPCTFRQLWHNVSLNCIVCLQCPVYSVKLCGQYGVKCVLCSVVCIVPCVLCSVQCVLCPVFCAVCSVQCVVCSVLCARGVAGVQLKAIPHLDSSGSSTAILQHGARGDVDPPELARVTPFLPSAAAGVLSPCSRPGRKAV